MSNQCQIFWDPYLNTLIYEIPTTNYHSAPSPAIVTPEDFQAFPNTVATFTRNPNAPLGTFQNPHPHPYPSATAANVPHPNMAAPTTPVSPQGRIQWQIDPSAPVGSYFNAHPYVPPTPIIPTTAAPAAFVVPAHQHDHPVDQTAIPTRPTWQEDFTRMFNSINLNASMSEPAPPPHRETAADALASTEAPSTQAADPNPHAPKTRQRQRTRSRSRNRSSGRHVRFADEETRRRANAEAAAVAALRAHEMEVENREYIDTLSVIPPHRQPRTHDPASAIAGSDGEQESPQPRSSSTASTIDPMTTHGAPIPAAPSRNPGFRDPRSDVPARVGHSEMAETCVYEEWPPCNVCQDRPATIRNFGILFCEGCLGQALVAEERRGRSRLRR